MNRVIKTAAILFTIGTALLVAQSNPLYWIGYGLDQIIFYGTHKDCSHSLKISDLQDAASMYQRLAQEAYTALHVPNTVAVKKYPADCLLENTEAAAHAENTFILLNEKALDNACGAFKKLSIYHEAIHVKYHDKMSSMINTCALFFPIGMALSNLPLVIPFALSLILNKKQSIHAQEHRADTEAAYGMHCAICLTEAIASGDPRSFAARTVLGGYCSHPELMDIAQELFEQQQTCSEEHRIFLEKYTA
jgi:hypothetical protein